MDLNAYIPALKYGATTTGDITFTESGGTVTVTDLTITSEATGDLLYFNGTNWIRLGIGSTGSALQVKAGIPAWV